MNFWQFLDRNIDGILFALITSLFIGGCTVSCINERNTNVELRKIQIELDKIETQKK